jgi:NtrC-family two-component system sensor histidine kinase KinB
LSLFFIIIFGLSIISTNFVTQLADNSKTILKDNYESVKYSINMLKALNEIHSLFTDQLVMGANDTLNQTYVQSTYLKAKKSFDENLALQKQNITEKNEESIVKDLKLNYEKYIVSFTGITGGGLPYSVSDFAVLKPRYEKIRDYILNIYLINMSAIVEKNDNAVEKAEQIVKLVNKSGAISLSLTGIFILIYLLYLINIKQKKR